MAYHMERLGKILDSNFMFEASAILRGLKLKNVFLGMTQCPVDDVTEGSIYGYFLEK